MVTQIYNNLEEQSKSNAEQRTQSKNKREKEEEERVMEGVSSLKKILRIQIQFNGRRRSRKTER
jgi:hypothetical protein